MPPRVPREYKSVPELVLEVGRVLNTIDVPDEVLKKGTSMGDEWHTFMSTQLKDCLREDDFSLYKDGGNRISVVDLTKVITRTLSFLHTTAIRTLKYHKSGIVSEVRGFFSPA